MNRTEKENGKKVKKMRRLTHRENFAAESLKNRMLKTRRGTFGGEMPKKVEKRDKSDQRGRGT